MAQGIATQRSGDQSADRTAIRPFDVNFLEAELDEMRRRITATRVPLIVTHGWPGSSIEQLKIIDPLTKPTAHGASASDAFHVADQRGAIQGKFTWMPINSGGAC